MQNPIETLAERTLRERVRQTLQHAPVFKLDYDLPDSMRLLLERLDQLAGGDAETAGSLPAHP